MSDLPRLRLVSLPAPKRRWTDRPEHILFTSRWASAAIYPHKRGTHCLVLIVGARTFACFIPTLRRWAAWRPLVVRPSLRCW